MELTDDMKDYIRTEVKSTPKKIVKHEMVGFGTHARDIFICDETTGINDYIVTAYVVIDERDDCYNAIHDDYDDKNEDLKALTDIGCDFFGTSVYYTVPCSEIYCRKDKKVAGIAVIKSYIIEYMFEDKPEGCTVENWLDFIDKDAIYAEVESIIRKAAQYLIDKESK